jgi:hypothetical protein
MLSDEFFVLGVLPVFFGRGLFFARWGFVRSFGFWGKYPVFPPEGGTTNEFVDGLETCPTSTLTDCKSVLLF